MGGLIEDITLSMIAWRDRVHAFPARLASSFFLLGVINNVLYVMILSAALDLVGAETPKSVVLLANILPSVLVKLTIPFVLQGAGYKSRVSGVVLFNMVGMILVSQSKLVGTLLGIGLASAASGAGEITFLQISHAYPAISLVAWSSGTGGAGILGGGLYVASTTWCRISPERTLLASAILPLLMGIVYFYLLPKPLQDYAFNARDLDHPSEPLLHDNHDWNNDQDHQESLSSAHSHDDSLVYEESLFTDRQESSQHKISLVRPLILPYMVPLFLVYFAEYSINQGISPTLLFELKDMPFSRYRDVYPTYATIYQVGVFCSRSSSPFFRLRRLYIPVLGQCFLLGLMLTQAFFVILPSIYILFALVLLEGIFGGLVYVNAFHNISETTEIEEKNKEFSIGVVGVADSSGILMAAIWSLWLEPTVCQYQVNHGRPWCRME